MYTDQGAQVTSFAWTNRLKPAGIRILMDGKGRCIDSPRAFLRINGADALDMSRLWRSRKCECVCLHHWETGSRAKAGIANWITFYNHHRRHSPSGSTSTAVFYRRTIAETQTGITVSTRSHTTPPDTIPVHLRAW